MTDRYDTSILPEDQYEPGSGGTVLKNLLGITTREAMEIAETEALWAAQRHLLGEVEQDQVVTASDICNMRRLWLGEINPGLAATGKSISARAASPSRCLTPFRD